MNQKQRLIILMRDGRWYPNRELNEVCFAYSQRLGELRKAGIESESRCVDAKHGLFEFRLVTPFSMIDINKCCLKPIEEIIPEHDSKGQYLLPIMGSK